MAPINDDKSGEARPDDDRPDDDVLAGEYVLGVLEADERRAVEARIARDPAFAALVVFWMGRLTPLSDAIAPVAPPARLKARIDDALFEPARKGALWNSLAFWRTAALFSTAIALLAGAALFIAGTGRVAERAALVAALTPANAPALLFAEFDPRTGAIRIRDAALAELVGDAGNAAELWIIPADGTPRSLGLINAVGETRAVVGEALRALIDAGGVLAVSIEPFGGSPTGAPTGPVVAVGALKRL